VDLLGRVSREFIQPARQRRRDQGNGERRHSVPHTWSLGRVGGADVRDGTWGMRCPGGGQSPPFGAVWSPADPPTRGRWVPAVRLLSVTTVENNACRSFVDDVN